MNAEPNHTHGPYSFDATYIVAPDPFGQHPDIYIAEIICEDDEGRVASQEQQEANQCLLAAAPDLLAALVAAEGFLSGFEGDELQDGIDNLMKQARGAIALATGGAL